MGQKVKLDITADSSAAVAEVRKVDDALKKTAAEGSAAAAKVGKGFQTVEQSVTKAAKAFGPLGGVIARLSPEAGALSASIAGLTGTFEGVAGAGTAAGLSVTAVAAAFAVAAAQGAIVYGVFASLTEEQDRNAASSKLLAEQHEKLAPLLAKERDAAIELRVARGELSEGDAAALRTGLETQSKLQDALKGTQGEITRLRDVQGSFSASVGDAAAAVRDFVPWFNPLAYAIDGVTVSTAEAEKQILKLQAGQEADIETAKRVTATLNESAEATAEVKARTEGAAKAVRDHAAATTLAKAEHEAGVKAALDYAAGLQRIVDAGRASTEANLLGVAREEAARARALETLESQYVAQVTLARGNFAALAEVDAAYLASREQIEAASAERVAAIRADTAEKAAKLTADAVKATQDAEATKLQAIAGTLQSAAGIAGQLFDMGTGYQADVLRALEADLAANEANMTKGQAKELQKRIDAQRTAARRSFEIAKAAKIAEALVSTSLAVINAIAQSPPPSPFGLIGAGLAAAAGAAAVAQIASQEPSFHAGTGNARRYSAPDEVRATLLEGEAVLSRRAVAELGGPERINDWNAGRREPERDARPVVTIQYRHREHNEFIRDNLLLGGPLADAIGKGKRVGHRDRSYG